MFQRKYVSFFFILVYTMLILKIKCKMVTFEIHFDTVILNYIIFLTFSPIRLFKLELEVEEYLRDEASSQTSDAKDVEEETTTGYCVAKFTDDL